MGKSIAVVDEALEHATAPNRGRQRRHRRRKLIEWACGPGGQGAATGEFAQSVA